MKCQKKCNNYISDNDELRDKKRELMKNKGVDNLPRADSFNIKIDKHYLDGKKSSLDEITNLDIVVFDAKITNSKFTNSNSDKKKMLIFQFSLIEEDLATTYIIFTSATNLIEFIKQFLEIGHDFPFRTVISKQGKSYVFN